MQKIYSILFICTSLFFMPKVLAVKSCAETIPNELRVPEFSNEMYCTEYEKEFEAVDKNDPMFEQLFKLHVAKFSNIDGSVVRFKSSQKDIYRSAILSENIALLSELVKERRVQSLVVITNSNIFDIVPWLNKERSVFSALGGSQFIHILDFDDRSHSQDNSEIQYMQHKIASIIRLVANAKGNVLIHCLGGEHKTELIFEVMQRCINGVDMENIIQRYKCHSGWKDDKNKCGFRQSNIVFIQNYPCDLVKNI